MSLEGNATAKKLRGKIKDINVLCISAYAIAVKHGFKGTEEEWLESLQGEATPEFIAMVEKTEETAEKAQQAYGDFLNQLGTDVATLVGGKIPMSQIPATATQEIYTVSDEADITKVAAQRGDLCEIITDMNGLPFVERTFQLLGDDSTVRSNWVEWGTSYAVSSGHSHISDVANNAAMINGHRLIEMSAEDFATAVKEADTYYLVY